MSDWSDPTLPYSARIKNLYVELHDYAYFHSPSEIGSIDRRFTGRREILQRLKSLLTQHETPSGAYLVTGYRGAGKSSLVAKALSDLSFTRSRHDRGPRYLRISTPLIVLPLFGGVFEPILLGLAVAFAIFCAGYLFITDPFYPDLLLKQHRRKHRPWGGKGESRHEWKAVEKAVGRAYGRCFYLAPERGPRHRLRSLTQDLFLLSLLVLVGHAAFSMFDVVTYFGRLFAYFLLFAVLVLATSMGTRYAELSKRTHDRDERDQDTSRPTFRQRNNHRFKKIMQAIHGFWRSLEKYVRYSHRVNIKVNLGQDDLKEIDILRLIAKNIHTNYEHFTKYALTDLPWRVLRILLLFLLVGTLYYLEPFYKLNLAIRQDLHLHCYFPSQGEFLLSGGAETYYSTLDEMLGSTVADAEEPPDPASETASERTLRTQSFSARRLRQALDEKPWSHKYWRKDPKREQPLEKDGEQAVVRPLPSNATSVTVSSGPTALEVSAHLQPESVRGPAAATNSGPSHMGFDHPFRPGLSGQLQRLGMTTTTYLDTFVQVLYRPVRYGISLPFRLAGQGLSWLARDKAEPLVSQPRWGQFRTYFLDRLAINDAYRPLPLYLDYLFLGYLILTWYGIGMLVRFPPMGVINHRVVLRRLRDLNEMIDAQVTRERGPNPLATGSWMSVQLGRKQTQVFPILTDRDIEKHLLEILGLIERIPRLTVRPEFIFIFDELDKIQPHFPIAGADRQSPEVPDRDYSPVEAERERQHRILTLVSNLKHFLTTAPAKFIFIAGREMFDAALADVSDRHYFMGSVFNEVLHVPSFLSDNSDDRLSDITSLTEYYLCQFLLPAPHRHQGVNLRTYNNYLREELLRPDYIDNFKVAVRKQEKIIYDLHNFITYVTYRSNGAPKKITKFIEHYLVPMTDEIKGHEDSCVVGLSSRSLYLQLGYYDQYTFGMITYLGSPLILSLNRSIKDYGDKILVSSSFLLDHIYKFHGHGFSWRNLELLPEIVDINRAPQLRELIANIMRFLGRSHISQIASGLNNFKFNKRIVEEISFLSKISEYESAAFNFTLDESLIIKRHFYQKLQHLQASHESSDRKNDAEFIHSVAFIRMILGDLHFYDGELDSAIVEYMEAVQELRQPGLENASIDLIVLMVRNFLKLGLAFERKRSYDSALVTYGRVASLASHIGERVAAGETQPVQRLAETWQRMAGEPGQGVDAERDFKKATFESIRLIHQPIFAELQLMEKSTLGGITDRDIERVAREFDRMLNRQDRMAATRYLIDSEYNNKIGDIVFFKNGPAIRDERSIYCAQEDALCSANHEFGTLVGKGRRLPCRACGFYLGALKTLCTEFLEIASPESGGSILAQIFGRLSAARRCSNRAHSLRELGTTLSSAGDTFLSCAPIEEIDQSFLIAVFGLIEDQSHEERQALLESHLRGLGRGMKKLEEVVVFYLSSAVIFGMAGDSRACAFQIIKVLYVIREFIAMTGKLSDRILPVLRQILAPRAMREMFRSHEGTHRLEIERLQEILENRNPAPDETRYSKDYVNLSRLSVNAEATEILVLLDEIELKMWIQGQRAEPVSAPIEIYPIDMRCSPFAQFSSVYSRIHILRLRGNINYVNFVQLGYGKNRIRLAAGEAVADAVPEAVTLDDVRPAITEEELKTLRPELDAVLSRADLIVPEIFPAAGESDDSFASKVAIEFLITDSIYCFHEIIRFLGIYGVSYMASNTMRAAAHLKLAQWCDYYYAYLKYRSDKDDQGVTRRRLEKRLKVIMGPSDMVHLSPNYHNEMALLFFKAAIEAHNEGQAYSELLEKMFYLDDDFADQLEHFCAGLERFRINSGSIDLQIENLNKRLEQTKIYRPERFDGLGPQITGYD